MKKTLLVICTCVLILLASFIGYHANNDEPQGPVHKGNLTSDSLKNDYTQLYTVDSIPSDLDTVDFRFSITFNPQKKRHVLALPHAGTITDVIISDTLFYVPAENTHAKIYREGSFYVNEPVLLDISHLAKGKYHVHLLGCSIGGLFSLRINR